MEIVQMVVAVVAGYIFGSIPSGLIIVRLMTGQDVRQVGSGRTGGTNAFRAAGPAAGLLTTVVDGFKAAIPVWLTMWMAGGNHWAEALAGLAAVLGHNYSIFMAERIPDPKGGTKLKFRGGAGGSPSVGATGGLWLPSLAFILPAAALIFFAIGYASLATLSVGLMAILIFTARAIFFGGPWEYVFYSLVVFALQLWALRPNIGRLIDGTERAHSGWAKRRAERLAAQAGDQTGPNLK